MTDDMKAFMALNAKHKIIEGIRIMEDGKEPNTIRELEKSNVKYVFENGSSLVLSQLDVASNEKYSPVWRL